MSESEINKGITKQKTNGPTSDELAAKLKGLRIRQLSNRNWNANTDGKELLETERLIAQGTHYEINPADVPGLQMELRTLQSRQTVDIGWNPATDGKRLLELQDMLRPQNLQAIGVIPGINTQPSPGVGILRPPIASPATIPGSSRQPTSGNK